MDFTSLMSVLSARLSRFLWLSIPVFGVAGCAESQTIGTANLRASQITPQLTSASSGTGYFVLLTGPATCGSAAQTIAGLDSTGSTATRRGSLALTAKVTATYTIRNLLASTTYTL